MALPANFSSPEEYFEEVIRFLESNQKYYNFSNVDVLVEGVLDLIDSEGIGLGGNDVTNDGFLKKLTWYQGFEDNLLKFSPKWETLAEISDLEYSIPLSDKKKMEILFLSNVIKRNCDNLNLNTVVDVGCGLGYLSEILNKHHSLNVLGIDVSEQCIKSAKKRQEKYHKTSKSQVIYWQYKVETTSSVAISEKIEETFPTCDKFCLVGLHACADLTVDSVTLFMSLENARSLIVMPCCYHKMARRKASRIDDDSLHGFINFPLSNVLKSLCEKRNYKSFLRIPFLRLATQPPFVMSNLEDAVFRLLSRATLQLYAKQVNKEISKTRRKAVNVSGNNNNFDIYVETATQNGYTLKCKCQVNCECDNSFDICHLKKIWRETAAKRTQAAILILIQNLLQPVFENFVLFDRLMFLRELGVNDCRFVKIIDQKVSPRCFVLIVNK